MFKNILFTIFLSVITIYSTKAETIKIIDNDSLLNVYLSKDKFEIDTNAQAVILYDGALADITIRDFNDAFYQRLEYTVEKCFKIINKEALDLAEISIPFTKDLKVKDVSVFSIYFENGILVKKKVLRNDIIKEKISDDAKMYKFNLSNIKVGSIIYYTYTYKMDLGKSLVSDYFPLSWNFQNSYPTLESKLELKIPFQVNFSAIPKNTHFTNVNTYTDLSKNTHAMFSSSIDSNKYNDVPSRRLFVWKRNNVEVSPEGDYIINPESKREKINIYISSYFPVSFMKMSKRIPLTWTLGNKAFFYDQPYLGGWIFKPQDTLSSFLNQISLKDKSNLAVAKSIYKYVRDSISGLGYSFENRVWASRSPKNTFIQKKGTSSDKNILLAALLRKAGFESFPVVLSTTDNEKLTAEHFEPDALNHLIIMVIIDSTSYYLDASSKYLPFGVLKPKCYNDFAWLADENGIALSMKASSLFDKTTCMATLKPTDKKGVFNLKMNQRFGNVSGPMLRSLWDTDSLEMQKFLDKNIQQLNYKVKIIDRSFINIANPDTPLMISYNLEVELDESGSYMYLNPFFKRIIESNPFKDMTRKYPIEFPNAASSQFLFKFQLPEGYMLEEPDNATNLDFNNGEMTYSRSMLYDPKQRIISLNGMLQSKITKIAVEDYKELRSFYESIVDDQNKSMILKKIN